jgi:hypothetical protein
MTQPETFPHSRSLRLHRRMEGPGTFFVTKNLQPRISVIDGVIASEICNTLCFYCEKNEISLAAFVVMPDDLACSIGDLRWKEHLHENETSGKMAEQEDVAKIVGSRIYVAGWFPRHQSTICETVPICLRLHRRESSQGRIGENAVRLAVVIGQCPVSKLLGTALAMELWVGELEEM